MSFAASDAFISEVSRNKLRSAYVFIGDEVFFRDRCRAALIQHLVPPGLEGFCLHDFDLSETRLEEILDHARTPSLMARFQLFFIGNVKLLYARGSKKEEFAAIQSYSKNPNPNAVLIFVADHIRIPADIQRMELADRDRYERIRETLGECCGIIELARVDETDATGWVVKTAAARGSEIDRDAARELVDALGADMMLVSSELEKLLLYADEKKRITLADVETMVLAAKQRSLYELTDAISAKDTARALDVLEAILGSGDGEDAGIGHLYMIARTFRQMLVVLERNVRDSRAIWQALWPGFRVPPFAAEALIRQARRYPSRSQLTLALRLVAEADRALRSSPASKRLVLEQLVIALASKSPPPTVMGQRELPV